MNNFNDWFRPALLRWLDVSHTKTKEIIEKTVEVEKMKKIDNLIKNSSSAIDTTSALSVYLSSFLYKRVLYVIYKYTNLYVISIYIKCSVVYDSITERFFRKPGP